VIKSYKKENKSISKDIIEKWTAEILLGLQKIHRAGKFDLKINPSNVWIDEKGKIKLLPLELYNQKLESLSDPQKCYFSPEIFDGKINFACDIWAVGCVLFELCALEVFISSVNNFYK